MKDLSRLAMICAAVMLATTIFTFLDEATSLAIPSTASTAVKAFASLITIVFFSFLCLQTGEKGRVLLPAALIILAEAAALSSQFSYGESVSVGDFISIGLMVVNALLLIIGYSMLASDLTGKKAAKAAALCMAFSKVASLLILVLVALFITNGEGRELPEFWESAIEGIAFCLPSAVAIWFFWTLSKAIKRIG